MRQILPGDVGEIDFADDEKRYVFFSSVFFLFLSLFLEIRFFFRTFCNFFFVTHALDASRTQNFLPFRDRWRNLLISAMLIADASYERVNC